jgi:hypothetical protein
VTLYYATLTPTLPRKLIRELFRDPLKNPNCYQSTQPNGAHPHLMPSLEVIDDSGVFRGWVSVEASLWPQPTKYTNQLGVNWNVSDN